MSKIKFSRTTHAMMEEAKERRQKIPGISSVMDRNICSLIELRHKAQESRSREDRVADAITAFSGSIAFLWLHVAWFAFWVAANIGWLGIPPFDPYPFSFLTMVVSLEAIFLSTFVLISQNRMQAQADQMGDLDVQIDLLAEHEITRILVLVDKIARKVGVSDLEGKDTEEIRELEKDVMPEEVLKEIAEREKEGEGPKH